MTRVEINGEPATVEAVHRAATWGYGHYTSMQVRGRAVAGLSLHIRRLHEGSAVLFPDAAPPDEDLIKRLIGHALGDTHDASVQVTILPNPATRIRTDVMVSVFEPVPDDARPPIRVRTVRYERELPHLKHLATLGQTFRRIEARHAGFDDVLFVDRKGSLCEGSGWNIAFWDGARVVWPDGPQLAGITMQLLRLGLHRLGIPDASRRLTPVSLHEMTAAVASNSHGAAQPIAAIDDRDFPGDQDFIALLQRAWREADWAPIP